MSEGAESVVLDETKRKRPPSEHAFDAAASLYDSWFEIPLGRMVDELERDLLYRLAAIQGVSASPRQGDCERVLDVGTGTGHFAADLTLRGCTVVGMDLSAEMLDVAQSKATRVRLVRGDAAALPLSSQSFDLVLSVTALEFVANPQRAIQEMWRAVRPGGKLVVGVLNALSPWAWVRHRESQQQETPFSYAQFFTPWAFVRLLRPLGPVKWNSSVFIGPQGQAMRWAWALERLGRALLKPFGALLVGRVRKWV